MPYQFNCAKILFAVALFMGSTIPAFGATAVDGATQANPSKHDLTVVLATKDKAHPHFGEGSGVGFVVNGIQGRTLVLVRGKTYTFEVDTNPMHDFYLSTDPVGWGINTLTEGVEGNFTFKGVVTFKPTAETPDLVYYQCRNHKYMGGTIHIVNPGEEDKIKISEPAAKAASDQKIDSTLDRNEVKQRLNFVEVFIGKSDAAKRVGKSDAAKRIAASGNKEAKEIYEDAQARLAAAKDAFYAGRLREAKTKADEAMSLMTEATQRVPSKPMQIMNMARNDELVQGLKTIETSYKQSYETIASKGGTKDIPKLDSDKIRRTMDLAKALSEKGSYYEANKILSRTMDEGLCVMSEVSSTLNKMLLANKAISYEMKFSSPCQEYEHDLVRFSGLEEAIQQAVAQEQPPPSIMVTINSFVNKGKEKRDQASADAKQQNYEAALENIRNGIDQLESASRLLNLH